MSNTYHIKKSDKPDQPLCDQSNYDKVSKKSRAFTTQKLISHSLTYQLELRS